MASWIIFIHEDYPDHWGIARDAGFWDMTSHHKIELGDTVYFWQSGGGSLVSQCSATTPAYPITSTDRQPWDDTGTRTYKARVNFDYLSESPSGQPTWKELQNQWGYNYFPRLRSFNDPKDEQVLAQHFDTSPIPDPYTDDEREEELNRLGFDLRTYDLRSIARRQGQRAFRNKLLTAYGNRCAVTGTTSKFVLEAAHVSRYLGAHTNHTSNGLLLRADIHTLFDLHRLTITKDYVVKVDQKLDRPYIELGDTSVHLPMKASERPLVAKLEEHNAACDWL